MYLHLVVEILVRVYVLLTFSQIFHELSSLATASCPPPPPVLFLVSEFITERQISGTLMLGSQMPLFHVILKRNVIRSCVFK